jgi:hypothetical protein
VPVPVKRWITKMGTGWITESPIFAFALIVRTFLIDILTGGQHLRIRASEEIRGRGDGQRRFVFKGFGNTLALSITRKMRREPTIRRHEDAEANMHISIFHDKGITHG